MTVQPAKSGQVLCSFTQDLSERSYEYGRNRDLAAAVPGPIVRGSACPQVWEVRLKILGSGGTEDVPGADRSGVIPMRRVDRGAEATFHPNEMRDVARRHPPAAADDLTALSPQDLGARDAVGEE